MIDLELTPKIKEWLDTEPSKRDIMAGAEILLRITRNRILYTNIVRNPSAYAGALEYHLNKIYMQRLQDITHRQVRSMMTEVESIAKARGLSNGNAVNTRSEFQRGKRADHDDLPADVQKLYVENADIMRRMRDLHTQLRMITPENSTCPDSDRYPLAKHLIELDARYRDNWNKYDHYVKGSPLATVVPVVDPRTESKNAAKLCNLLLGKYVRTEDDALAERIREAYGKIHSPSDNLRSKMRAAGLM